MRTLYHPDREQISLPAVLDALSDPTRLAITVFVADRGESICRDFCGWGSKTNLTYHIAKLREAGILKIRIAGVFRHVTIRWDDVDARFPGLLKQLIDTARRERVGIALPEAMNVAPPKARRALKAAARTTRGRASA